MFQSKRYRLYVQVIICWLTVISVVILSGCSSMPLHNAMFKGNLDEAKQFIVKQQDIDKPNSLGFRPLHIAADKGQSEIFKALVAQGVTIDPKTNNGWTPLMFVVMRGYRTMVEILLEKGADVNARNNAGATPIMIASYNGRELIFDCLFDNEASLDVKTKKGFTPLMMASENGHFSIANKLIGLGVDVNAQTTRETNALLIAINKGNADVAEFLVESGSNVNAGDDAGWTPLMYAAKNGNGKLVQILIDKGADINAQSKGGASPVFIAVFHDHIALATKMIHLGTQPISIENHVNDTFASAKLYKLMAEIREKEGNKPETADHYQTAATLFGKASAGFKKKAGEMKKTFWKATFANALMAGIAAGGATYQAQQTGVGMQQYQQVGTRRFVEMEKTFIAKAEQCHALEVECSSLSQKLRQ